MTGRRSAWMWVWMLCGLWATGDELALAERTEKGTFVRFEKGFIEFQTWEGKTLREKLLDVRALRLDKPVKAILRERSARKEENVLFQGYENGSFRFSREGRDVIERESQVRSLLAEQTDAAEYMRRAEAARAAAADTAAPDNLDPASLAEMGVVTVVHFHQPDSPASVRQGSYVRRLAEDSRGRMVCKVVTLTNTETPAATKNDIASLPQFWFYSRSRKLVTKLVERFTPEDIREAVERARRG